MPLKTFFVTELLRRKVTGFGSEVSTGSLSSSTEIHRLSRDLGVWVPRKGKWCDEGENPSSTPSVNPVFRHVIRVLQVGGSHRGYLWSRAYSC